MNKTKIFDAIVIGAGAAGLMYALCAGKRHKSVLVLDKANKVGKKILMSGGGRCNFTNLHIEPEKYLSHNPHFCKSALSRYSQWDFIAMVERHGIDYYEKTLGQLFCHEKSQQIVAMLLHECQVVNVKINTKQAITRVSKTDEGFIVKSNGQMLRARALVIACGGLSIPTMGASPFGYELAKQFGLKVYPTRAGLVPFTLHQEDKHRFESLSGIALDCQVSCNNQSFTEALLFTHRGLSGPAMLQISSYWNPGDVLNIKLCPDIDVQQLLEYAKNNSPQQQLKTLLSQYLAKRMLPVFIAEDSLHKSIKQLTSNDIKEIALAIQAWQIKPNGTEGYRTAEVTLGGVDCNEVSSKTFEAKKIPGLYFIGEVLDVTGWLGGYNFQWAWSSAWAAAQAL